MPPPRGISLRGFARARAAVAGVGAMSEEAIGRAMAYGMRELGMVLEGSAACALAAVLVALPRPLQGGDVVVVLTGRNVDQRAIDRVLAM